MTRDNKKRVMPRHLMCAMVQLGIIPIDLIKSLPLSNREQKTIERLQYARKQKLS